MSKVATPEQFGYEPMKVTAWLQCGVISDATLPLDAVLFYQVNRDAGGAQDITLPGEQRYNRRGARVRLWIIDKDHPTWYYAASFAQWNGTVAEGTDHWNKRFDQSLAHLVDFQGKRGKVIVEQGAYKAYHMPVFYRHALSVSWYLLGNIAWVREMLSTVTNVGKKCSQGWGAVLRWSVEPWAEDWSVWGPDGRLMRAIPDEGGVLTGLRPSYWLPRNQVRCRMPEGV
jgi:hypothetical protein